MKSIYQDEIDEYLRRKVPVTILKSNETGEDRWAISVNEDPEFWLNSYINKNSAINFCNKHGLPFEVIK